MHSSRVRLKIDLRKLKDNVSKLKNVSKSKIIAMIKANAYGHGIQEVYQYLKKECDVSDFGLASIEEAIHLRRLTKDYETNLIVFSDLAFSEENSFSHFIDEKIIPVISSWSDLDHYLSNNTNTSLPLFLKINTGMNRLGISFDDPKELVFELKKRGIQQIDHLMTHFSSSNLKIETGSKCYLQYEVFKKLKKELKAASILIKDSSVSNSGAIEQGFGFDETYIRPGILMYGASVLSNNLRKNALVKADLVSSMETSIIDSFDIQKGAEIGYGDVKVQQSGRLVLVGVGYGDGLPTRFSGATIKTEDEKGMIVGKINMDLTAILFPQGKNLTKGKRIKMWGDGLTNLSEISDEVGLIPYEILCNLGQRVNKEYIV